MRPKKKKKDISGGFFIYTKVGCTPRKVLRLQGVYHDPQNPRTMPIAGNSWGSQPQNIWRIPAELSEAGLIHYVCRRSYISFQGLLEAVAGNLLTINRKRFVSELETGDRSKVAVLLNNLNSRNLGHSSVGRTPAQHIWSPVPKSTQTRCAGGVCSLAVEAGEWEVQGYL